MKEIIKTSWILIALSAAEIILHNTSGRKSMLNCFSDDPLYDRYMQVTPDLTLLWKVSDDFLYGRLKYQGIGWVALGISVNESMVGSNAIIGLPDLAFEGKSPVKKFDLDSKSLAGVVSIGEVSQNLEDSYVSQDKNSTVLTFRKPLLEENGEISISKIGKNIFLWAVGRSNKLGHYKASGLFLLDLSNCENGETIASEQRIVAAADGMSSNKSSDGMSSNKSSDGMSSKSADGMSSKSADGGSSGYNKNAMIAHGLVAALAWSVFSPLAVATAWFRRLVPTSWIYLHVAGNITSYFLTLAAFFIAFTETSKNSDVSHFSKTHHIVGLVITIVATFQVILGFARPPVDKVSNREGGGPLVSPRNLWLNLHSSIGLFLLSISVYQTYTGLTLFTQNFGDRSILPFYWTLVIVFAFSALIIKTTILFIRTKESSRPNASNVARSRLNEAQFKNPREDIEKPRSARKNRSTL